MRRIEQETKKEILLELNKDKGLSASDLEDRLDVSRQCIKRHLNNFRDEGIVRREKIDLNPSWKWGHYIDTEVETRYAWKQYKADLSLILISVVGTVTSWFIFGGDEAVVPSLIPIFLFSSLVFYRAFGVADNVELSVKEG